MIPEIIPFPAIEIRTETFHESHPMNRKITHGKRMEFVHANKRFAVEGPPRIPSFLTERAEVLSPQVLHDDETPLRIMEDNPGYRNVNLVQKFADLRIVPIFQALRVVV